MIPVQDDNTKDMSLWTLAEMYSKNKLHLINRLDRPVSGLCLFQKKSDGKKLNLVKILQKRYTAIVKKNEMAPSGTLTHYLYKDAKRKMAVLSAEPKEHFTKVELQYEIIQVLDNYNVLKIELLQGKFHQIRAQLSFAGAPIKGDVKYGARRKNSDRFIHLHCSEIEIMHPTKKTKINIEGPLPSEDTLWQAVANQ